MTTRRSAAILVGALALTWAVTACGAGDGEPGPTPSATAETSAPAKTPPPKVTPTPTPSPTPTPDADALPPGFPDPASLIGKDSHDEQGADGSWHWVVGGTPLTLVTTFGSCFDGGSGEMCGYSIGGAAVVGPGGTPGPTDAALLALFRSTGALADGTPTWVVVDAVVVRPPGGTPALLELCDGAPAAAIYPGPGVTTGETIPVQAAWGPNADVTALVELDPGSLTCASMSD